jgi:hypothetical protein
MGCTTACQRREDVDDVGIGERVFGRGIRAVHKDDPFQHCRDPETLERVMHRTCLGELQDRLTALAAGWKEPRESREKSDFDGQR